MKLWQLILFSTIALLITNRAFALDVVTDGKAKCVIVIANDAPATDETAASLLADYIEKISGAKLRVQTEAEVPADTSQILVGFSDRAKSTAGNPDLTGLGTEGGFIKSASQQIILAGGEPRGTIYAVDTFLEENLGVRWWTSRDEFVPKQKSISVGNIDVKYVPKLLYREAYNFDPINSPEFAMHRKLNGHMSQIPAAMGGHYEILGWCHTSYHLLPPEKYFKAHPDWFSLQNGKRDTHNGQLCWSNPQMRAELVKNALEWIKKNASAGIISISQNDCIGNCQCDQCKAIDDAQGSPAGSLIAGVNAIAAEIHKQYPNFLVETLAYEYTRHPPKDLKPADNVLVRLCSIEADGSHPLNSNANHDFAADMEGWSKLAPNLFVWNYVTNFNFPTVPHPNFSPLGDDLKFFTDHHVIGVFEQGDSTNNLAGDMLPLRVWLLSQLMWNTDQDQNKLIDEFCNGYFGKAGPFMRQYLDATNASAKDPKFRANCFNQDLKYLTDDLLANSHKLFNSAEAAVLDQPAELARVKRERLVLDSMELQRMDLPRRITQLKADHKDDAAIKSLVQDYEARVRDWSSRAILAGMAVNNYNTPLEQFAANMMKDAEKLIPTTQPTH